MKRLPSYVVISPARNEAQFIELTLKSVTSQTVLPRKWVIVSDGSTDGTDDIVKDYTARHPCVSLDADISFEDDYFAFLLERMSADKALGVIGTPFRELSGETYDYRFVNIEHVSGACQVFRRECFEDIGGYLAVKGGSIDHIAVITARMKGWRTRTFTERACLHHRAMGTAGRSLLKSRFRLGMKDYCIGNHPLWEVVRIARQMTLRPLFTGGLALAAGYLWGVLRQVPRPVSIDLVAFHRREQMQRLSRFIGRNRPVVVDDVKPSSYCA
jgi:poly-beta-1,6-N-acetyl-D-glucosamine synthase